MSDPSSSGVVFGSAAEAYEQYRLGYPDEVARAVVAYSARPIHSALEIGAGTGKATRLFAGLGVHVTAVEPDPDMAVFLRRLTEGLPVETVLVTFENLDAHRKYDLLYSAAAWHWTDPRSRWGNALRALEPAGTLALFGVSGDLTDPALQDAVGRVERGILPPGAEQPGADWSIDELKQVGGFVDAEERTIPRSTVLAAEEYVGRLATVSAYLRLDPATRSEALRAVRALLPAEVVIDSSVRLVLARRETQ
ncbi:MAG TPA: class I SAM-dependent methyltransferase [Solirubrobacteraceae bacterium]|nr:class I SAM-dependent methyltransferase [Solirubrobacteraceae bacterium]